MADGPRGRLKGTAGFGAGTTLALAAKLAVGAIREDPWLGPAERLGVDNAEGADWRRPVRKIEMVGMLCHQFLVTKVSMEKVKLV